MSQVLLGVASGLASGLLGGLIGIGGGIILIPLLVYVFHADMHTAAGTSLAIIIPTAVVGAATHLTIGNMDWRLTLMIAPAAAVGALLGARLGENIPSLTLRRFFAVLLLLVSIKVLYDAYRESPAQAANGPEATSVVEQTHNES